VEIAYKSQPVLESDSIVDPVDTQARLSGFHSLGMTDANTRVAFELSGIPR
jgi:hypothetical protein